MAKNQWLINNRLHKNIKLVNTQDVQFVEDLIQFLENMVSAVFVLENLHTKVKFLVLRNLAGNKGGKEENG